MINSNNMQGGVKFNCHWNQTGPVISDEQFEIINYWREVLYNMDLIGAYENGIAFGNISMRIIGGNQFIITGSATGEIPELEPGHYIKAVSYTHLRAHETDSYLVCRLLLEKKK